MDKLFTSLKVTDDAVRTALRATAHYRLLLPKETLHGGLPKSTWIFIESGFIKKTKRGANGVEVYDLLPEGACVLLTDCSTESEDRMGVCIQATEPTGLYYLLPGEVDELCGKFPSFGSGHFAFTMVAAADIQKRTDIWLEAPADRFNLVKNKYPFLLRAGAAFLADYLRLTGKEYTALLAYYN